VVLIFWIPDSTQFGESVSVVSSNDAKMGGAWSGNFSFIGRLGRANKFIMNPDLVSSVARWGLVKKFLPALVFLGVAAHAVAEDYVSSEDTSRFQEQPYRAAEPGMLPPSAYIEMAKKAAHQKSAKVTFLMYSDGIVTRRFYRNAPPADRDIICVQFVYEGAVSGGGLIGRGLIYSRADRPTPVIQALIRKDLSKIYLNRIYYKPK
jgi:hypothetical protein